MVFYDFARKSLLAPEFRPNPSHPEKVRASIAPIWQGTGPKGPTGHLAPVPPSGPHLREATRLAPLWGALPVGPPYGRAFREAQVRQGTGGIPEEPPLGSKFLSVPDQLGTARAGFEQSG